MQAFKRKIFYLSGFDPRGARYYHQMFGEQATLFNAMAGRNVTVGKRRREPPHSVAWTIEDRDPDTRTDYVFLGWDDVVRTHWVKNPLALLKRSAAAYWNFTRLLDWPIVKTFPFGVRFAFYYPGVSAIALPILLGLLLCLPAIALLGWGWGLAMTAIVAVAVSMFIVKKIQGFWLLRFIIFNDTLANDRLPPDVEARMNDFANQIAASFDEDWDEILFVTHSNGSIMGVPMMARLLDRFGGTLPDRFGFVTLGSCIALIGNRKDSHRFHDMLAQVGRGDFRWLDIGSITDGACIAGIDPCISTREPRRARLFQTSPRWFKYCDPATYQARRRNKYETHFDYLRTFDRLSPLDYIALASGARPLAQSIAAFEAENG
ncbi:hypothetical protein [Sphingomonas montanisoli]|uniref:Transmembrane protein n=1 Tax=Sphingomonas montanisoli TaxID=2606412 RepID=A0A5D9C551_9SPHN|nr:hypothetical protein [Sphingomonas montanisoli]TZG25171.1 hypothetical protein FYJ91_18145 [Sphingomonas montanisoli]